MCKKSKFWPQILADLGYKVEVIEQKIRNSKDEELKPDLILSTNQNQPHVLIVECKGGLTVDKSQLDRYENIVQENFVYLVYVHSKENLNHDVCFVDSESNHHKVVQFNINFPIITFGSIQIFKTNKFRRESLNNIFHNPIDLKGMVPTLDYYPFSETDDVRVVVPYILRALLSLARRKGRAGQNVLDEAVFTDEDMLESVHRYWKFLSVQHQHILKERVRRIIGSILIEFPDFKTQIEQVQAKGGIRVTASLQALQRTCNGIISKYETRRTLEEFPHE